jgi:hypothetical protein
MMAFDVAASGLCYLAESQAQLLTKVAGWMQQLCALRIVLRKIVSVAVAIFCLLGNTVALDVGHKISVWKIVTPLLNNHCNFIVLLWHTWLLLLRLWPFQLHLEFSDWFCAQFSNFKCTNLLNIVCIHCQRWQGPNSIPKAQRTHASTACLKSNHSTSIVVVHP